jgi:hypothetical protein
MQKRFADIPKVGDRIRATGRTETGLRGDTHFEVQRLTNLRTNDIAENPDFADGAPPPVPEARRRGPARMVDLDQRLRNLEDEVDQLRREVQRLRRDG